MRVIFMGTPAFALPALNALMAAGYDICAVYTQPPRPAGRGLKLSPSPVHQLASQHQLSVYTPTSLKTVEAQEMFRAHEADIAVVAAYGLLLPRAILEAPRMGCINIHPSDLPRWRGAAPIQRTLMAGDRHTACCIMQMAEGLDTGDVLLRRPFTIAEGMNAAELHDAMAQMGAAMLPEAISGLAAHTITPQVQSTQGVTYAHKLTKDDCTLDLRKSASELYHQICGLAPSPAAHVMLGGEAVKILAAVVSDAPKGSRAGDIHRGENALILTCAEGALTVNTLKRPGKSAQSASEALRGWSLPTGNIFSNNA